MESLRDSIIHVQNGILMAVRVIATMEAGAPKTEATAALDHFRKSDKVMRQRLFILKVWRKHGQDIATQLASVKAGELLDPDLAKLLKEKQKSEQKIQRDLAKDRAAVQQQAKRFKADNGAGPSGYDRGSLKTGGYPRGEGGNARGGGGQGRGGRPKPAKE